MTWIFRALVGLLLLIGSFAAAATGCNSSKEAPACKDLASCCSDLASGGTSSCSATATSGELDDAACGQELEMYVSTGQCPGPSKPPVKVDAAAADAATD